MRTLLPACLISSFVLLSGCMVASNENNVASLRPNGLIRPTTSLPINFLSNDLDQAPQLKSGRIPPQPFGHRFEQGSAVVVFTINEKGRTENLRVVEQRGRYFAGNTVRSMKYWHFEPALKDGLPVATEAVIRFDFTGEVTAHLPKKVLDQ